MLDRKEEWAHIEHVDHDTRIDARHVLVAPSEDVPIVLQEEGELFAD